MTAQKRMAGAGHVHDRHGDRVGDVMNVSSAPVDLIPAYVPLAFFKQSDVNTGKCNKETRPE